MKLFKYISTGLFALLLGTACNDGIDSISYVPPGTDNEAPVIAISYPIEGTQIKVKEDVTSITFEATVTDDIEIQSITMSLDGTQIATFNSFKDYRRAVLSYEYDQITNGNHTFMVAATDLSGKSRAESVNFQKVAPYEPAYPGEIFYMPFNGDAMELVNVVRATTVGSPSYVPGKVAQAYKGAEGAYLSYPLAGNLTLGSEFSAAFWYNMEATADRAGILSISPVGQSGDDQTFKGFRFFREAGGLGQVLKLNVGTGEANAWFDGGDNASLAPGAGWVHIAFTISNTGCAVYFNGNVVSSGESSPINWDNCETLSIGSGAPDFDTWNHLSDVNSEIDELRLFNRALTQSEIQAMMR